MPRKKKPHPDLIVTQVCMPQDLVRLAEIYLLSYELREENPQPIPEGEILKRATIFQMLSESKQDLILKVTDKTIENPQERDIGFIWGRPHERKMTVNFFHTLPSNKKPARSLWANFEASTREMLFSSIELTPESFDVIPFYRHLGLEPFNQYMMRKKLRYPKKNNVLE